MEYSSSESGRPVESEYISLEDDRVEDNSEFMRKDIDKSDKINPWQVLDLANELLRFLNDRNDGASEIKKNH